jgi:hypothetical protein
MVGVLDRRLNYKGDGVIIKSDGRHKVAPHARCLYINRRQSGKIQLVPKGNQ